MNKIILPKKIVSYKDAADIIIEVCNDFKAAVVSTLGPMGQTTIIGQTGNEIPHVTKDGVTVSESIYYLDALKQSIGTLLKESSRKTSEEVGDGTTTSMLLACTLIENAMTYKKLKTINFRQYLEGMNKAVDYIIEYLQEETVEIEMNSKELKAVINISSNNDPKITQMLIDITGKIGAHGIIDVKLTEDMTTTVNVSDGAMIEGNVIEYPGTENIFEIDGECDIVLVEGAIQDIPTIKSLLSHYADSKFLVLIAKEFSNSIINTIKTNNNRRVTNIVLVESEGFGQSRIEILKDLAVITDSYIYSTDGSTEYSLNNFDLLGVGKVKGITVNSREVILYCNPIYTESEPAVARFEKLKEEFNQVSSTSAIFSSGEYNMWKRRMAKYVSLATINVGGTTRAEAAEKKDRFDDAVHAISAAINNGVLPGGGASFLRAINIIESRIKTFEGDELKGAQSIIHACKSPIRTLCLNSGFSIDEDIIQKLKNEENTVYDVFTQKVVNAYTVGILDPALVLIKTLDNASAVTKSIVNSNAFIIPDYNNEI